MYDRVAIEDTRKLILKKAIAKAKGQSSYEFQGKAFYKNIVKDSSYPRTDLNLALEELYKEGFLKGGCSHNPFFVGTKVTVTIPQRALPEHERHWLENLEKLGQNDTDKEALKPIGSKLKGFSFEQQRTLIEGLYKLRNCQDQHIGEPKYNISAQYLLGSSKLLDTLQKEAILFGIKVNMFASAHRYVCVAGNDNPEAVIIVENPHSFETAIRADKELRYAWISSYGFGISLDKSYKYGEMLATNITEHQNDILSLTRAGSPPSLPELLNSPKIFFWGDLDIGGLSIYQRLKAHLPQLELSGLYTYMVEQLLRENKHPYVKAVGKEGQKTFKAKEQLVIELLALVEDGGIDQELVTEEKISNHAGQSLTSLYKSNFKLKK